MTERKKDGEPARPRTPPARSSGRAVPGAAGRLGLCAEMADRVRNSAGTDDLLADVVDLLAEWSGFEAVGLRLREGGDYPYARARGLSEEFVRLESCLLPAGRGPGDGPAGEDAAPGPVDLECLCGLVIQSRLDLSAPFATPYGSFWTGDIAALRAARPGLRRLDRGQCASEGFSSFALVPLRSGGETIGLLQVADRRPGLLDPELVATFERFATFLSMVLGQRKAERELREARAALEREGRERRQADRERDAHLELLRLVNSGKGLEEMLGELVASLSRWSGCTAVAIRARRGGDFPYLGTTGFPEAFIREETSLCAAYRPGEEATPAPDGEPALECMCGAVVLGRSGPRLPCFTEAGSFWTNSTTDFLDALPEPERARLKLRGRCNAYGYESVALVPLRLGGKGYGLVQFNDRRRNRFTRARIAFLEGLGDTVAVSLAQRLAEGEVREAKAAAEAASRAKSDFMANMSHEIRTPMNGLLGMIDLALACGPDPAVREYLDLAKGSGQALLTIVNDILDLSKIEAGKVELADETFDLRAELEGAVRPLALVGGRKGLRFVLSVRPDVPEVVRGDAGRLRQVLANLVGNAVKFTQRGRIFVEVRPDEDRPDAGSLLFRVRDTGIGIPRKKLGTLFESFSQVGSSAHLKYGGTGLGLSISRSLVELMGGRIWVESRPGRGSVFSFTARFGPAAGHAEPLEPAPREAPRPVPLAGRLAAQPPRVLVAEDNQVNQLLAMELLRQRGIEATAAANGLEALDRLRQEPFDLVLMDVRMPEMGGIEATARIRAGEAGRRDIPVVALTAHALAGDRERLLAAGMDDYLSKPIDLDKLDLLLARFLGRPA